MAFSKRSSKVRQTTWIASFNRKMPQRGSLLWLQHEKSDCHMLEDLVETTASVTQQELNN